MSSEASGQLAVGSQQLAVGDTSVTLDLLIRALLALGTRPRQLAALL